MFLRFFFAISILLFLSSCDYKSPGKTSLQNLIALDTIIDYKSVDVYPLFQECNNCNSNEKQNLCFENELTKKIESYLESYSFKISKPFNETVYADLFVDNDGKISLLKLQSSTFLQEEIPVFDSIFKMSITQLPSLIQPSLKRGIPVKSKFKLPIVINAK